MSTEIKAAVSVPMELPRSLMALRILWSGRYFIAACSLLCLAAAVILSFVLPETFESSASLLLVPPPFKQSNDLNVMMPKVLSVPDYQILFTSDDILAEAVRKVRALGTWPPEALESIEKLSSLRKQMDAKTVVNEKTVNGVAYSPVIVLKARAGTPEHACDLAKAWAEACEELTAAIYQKGKTGLKEFVSGRFDASRDELMNVHEELLKIELEWNDELEHARLFNKHERLLTYEEKLTDLRIQIATTTKELEGLKTAFAQEPEHKTLWKSPPMTAVFLEGETKETTKVKKDQAAGYQEEVLNQTYLYLKEKIILKESELANMQEYEHRMMAEMDQLDAEVQVLRAESAQRSFDRKTLELQIGPLKGNYDLLAVRQEQAKIAEAEQLNITDIKVVAEPVVPDKKILPMRSLIVLTAVFLGFVASTAFVYLRAVIKLIV